jgi:hypothetical protein
VGVRVVGDIVPLVDEAAGKLRRRINFNPD